MDPELESRIKEALQRSKKLIENTKALVDHSAALTRQLQNGAERGWVNRIHIGRQDQGRKCVACGSDLRPV